MNSRITPEKGEINNSNEAKRKAEDERPQEFIKKAKTSEAMNQTNTIANVMTASPGLVTNNKAQSKRLENSLSTVTLTAIQQMESDSEEAEWATFMGEVAEKPTHYPETNASGLMELACLSAAMLDHFYPNYQSLALTQPLLIPTNNTISLPKQYDGKETHATTANPCIAQNLYAMQPDSKHFQYNQACITMPTLQEPVTEQTLKSQKLPRMQQSNKVSVTLSLQASTAHHLFIEKKKPSIYQPARQKQTFFNSRSGKTPDNASHTSNCLIRKGF